MRFIGLLFVGMIVTGACAERSEAERSEAEINEELDDFVRARNACQTVSDCTLIQMECPLPCFVAANVAHAEAVQSKADELIEEYESNGPGCVYRCAPQPERECRAGHCFPEP